MVRYEYGCSACGPWTVALPMGAAEARRTCPTCGEPSPRRWSAPLLNRMDPATSRARTREEASRDVPEVVTSVPPAARRRVRSDHRQARLPRP
jgi:putative FmdB family regulatory protein